MGFCCAERFAHAALTTSLMLGLLHAPITQLECSLVLGRMLHTLDELCFGCCVLMFTTECWGGVWEHLSSTSLCLGMSELSSQKQTCTELALLKGVATRTCRQLCSLEGQQEPEAEKPDTQCGKRDPALTPGSMGEKAAAVTVKHSCQERQLPTPAVTQ